MSNEKSAKADFTKLTEKLNSKFEARTAALKDAAANAKATSENIDPSKFKTPEVTYIHSEPKEVHEHQQTVVNNYYFDNIGYIALGVVTAGALVVGGLYLSGYFAASSAAVALSPQQVKAMASSIIENYELGATNKARFADTLYQGLFARAKDTPIDIKTLEEYILCAFEEAATYIGQNIDNIQNIDFVTGLKIHETVAQYVSNPITSYGSPARISNFLPMVKTTLAAGLVFTKIKAAFGFEINEDNSTLEHEPLFDTFDSDYSSDQCSLYEDLLLGNTTTIELEYCSAN